MDMLLFAETTFGLNGRTGSSDHHRPVPFESAVVGLLCQPHVSRNQRRLLAGESFDSARSCC